MRLVVATTLALTVASVFGRSAHAGLVPIVNQGFETPATTSATFPTGWTTFNSGVTGFLGSYNPYEFSGGNGYYIGANSTSDPANGGPGYPGIFGENMAYAINVSALSGLQQTLSASLLANTTYTFTVGVGSRNGTANNPNGFAGSLIQLLAGSTVIASSTDTVGPTAGTFGDQVALLANSNSFSGLIGQTLSISILTTNTAAQGRATDWDNVRLDATTVAAPVPEPSTLIPFGLAALGFGYVSARRRIRRTEPLIG